MELHPSELSRTIPTSVDADRPTPAALVAGEVPATQAPRPLSVFDMFRIGIGPSSSHTVGPMRAGLAFTAELMNCPTPGRIQVELFGSLGATGRGHNTDRAVLLGLAGFAPETVSIEVVESILPNLARSGALMLPGGAAVPMDIERDICFLPHTVLPYHVNALTLTAWAPAATSTSGGEVSGESGEQNSGGVEFMGEPTHPEGTTDEVGEDAQILLRRTYYSVGGGFVMVQKNDDARNPQVASLATGESVRELDVPAPFPFSSAAQLLEICEASGFSIAQVVRANEEAVRSRECVNAYLDTVADTMFRCVDAGTDAQGILPGGLDVPRRARMLASRLAGRERGLFAGLPGAALSDGLGEADRICGDASSAALHRRDAAFPRRWVSTPQDPMRAMDWVNLFALAVNEENAAGHRIVTAPTNGAAGVIPAVLGYLVSFCSEAGCSETLSVPNLRDDGVAPLKGVHLSVSPSQGVPGKGANSSSRMCEDESGLAHGGDGSGDGELMSPKSIVTQDVSRGVSAGGVHVDSTVLRRRAVHEFLLAATAIGALIKTNASIAGAEVGCQGEVGSASAMAAAGLAQALGGTPQQVENAAEIAMEHSLGLTCDPVAGLVQIPCIERNAIAAVKAINAARMALWGDGRHTVSLDAVIETMRQTGNDMLSKYKETSAGGLAVNVVEC